MLTKVVIATLISSLASLGFAQDTVPNTYVDLPVPQLTGWNDINVHTLDGVTGATPKSHVYSSEAAKNDPNVGSVAAVYWELDNGSGRSPGIQVVTDDFDVPTNNCIMASGELENEQLGVVLPKTCSDSKYSSKRYFFELTSSDVPVDLVFDLGIKDIRYKGIKDPATDGGTELAEFRENTDIGRIYRVIQKIINNTDERIASYTFEIGTGIGDDFQQLNYEEDGVSFELRTLVPRAFLEGETGAPDIEVWNPMTFATFSPKMFNDGGKKGVFGFLDHEVAGFMPPQVPFAGVEKSSIIDSGTSIIDGVIGSISSNYFDIAVEHGLPSGDLGTNMLGYMIPDSILPTVIGQYSTNVIGGESDSILAIWDGANWRSGRAGLDGDPETTPDNFAIIPENDPILIQWAGQLLGMELGELPGEAVVRFDSFLSDDLSGLNTDFYIYIDEKLFDETGGLKLDSITLRVTANSVKEVIGDVTGTETPDWMIDDDMDPITPLVSNAPSLAGYLLGADGTPIALNDVRVTEENTTKAINVLENDLFKVADKNVISLDDAITGGATIVSVNIKTQAVNGTATVYSGMDIDLANSIVYEGHLDFSGSDFFEYSVTVDADGAGPELAIESNTAKVLVTVQVKPIPDAPIAQNDSAVTFEVSPVAINVLANDDLNKASPITVTVSIDNAPLNGTAVVADDNTVLYTPAADYIGIDRFTYNVNVDGKLSNSALITVRIDESVIRKQYMDSSSSGNTSGLFLLGMVTLLLHRRKHTTKK